MSFTYKDRVITLNNYLDVFRGYEPDILDEIRSAILDDTPISPFINSCGSDSYKLGQFRLALREYLPTEYLNPHLSGRNLYLIRQGFHLGVDMNQVLPYINEVCILDNDVLSKVIEVVLTGTDITNIDFNLVTNDTVDVICEGLIKGYPMWLFVSATMHYTSSYIRHLLKGMQLGIDIHPFLDDRWSEEQVVFLLNYARHIDINAIVNQINPYFSIQHIEEIIQAKLKGLDITCLCLKDDKFKPLFNPSQMKMLRLALEGNFDVSSLLNPDLSPEQMGDLIRKGEVEL